MTEWREVRLGDLLAESGGAIRTGPFGSQLHRSDYSDDPTDTPVIMPKDMVAGRVKFDGIARVNQNKVAELAHHQLASGDIILARRGDVGRWPGSVSVRMARCVAQDRCASTSALTP